MPANPVADYSIFDRYIIWLGLYLSVLAHDLTLFNTRRLSDNFIHPNNRKAVYKRLSLIDLFGGFSTERR